VSNYFVRKSDSLVSYQPVTTKVVLKTNETKVFLSRLIQGPPGASWPEPFALAARFSEIASNDTAKTQARTNLDLEQIDLGTFN